MTVPASQPPTPASAPSQPPAAKEATRRLLDQLWLKNKPLVQERLATLERAADRHTGLSAESRAEAVGVAHKLAGSLGMYGLPRGTATARELEQELEDEGATRERLLALIAELTAEVNSR